MRKKKVFTLTPSSNRAIDSVIFVCADDTWKSVLEAIEHELDMQFLDGGWEGINLNIKCHEMTQAELDEIEEA